MRQLCRGALCGGLVGRAALCGGLRGALLCGFFRLLYLRLRLLPGLRQAGGRLCARAFFGLCREFSALLRRRGIMLQDPPLPLAAQNRPVVAVFSADILEAAVRGLPAWVHAPHAPAWVHEHWERYGMRPTGGEPTPAPSVGADEPARLIAQILEGGA